jgi:hypothetical protein
MDKTKIPTLVVHKVDGSIGMSLKRIAGIVDYVDIISSGGILSLDSRTTP